jgi:uncharacterized membrane protein HdeD (DUF308 family)
VSGSTLSGSKPRTADDATQWYILIARAIPAFALAMLITFTADHSAQLGLVSLGIFGITTGMVVAISAFRTLSPVARGIQLAQAAVSIVVGVVSLVGLGAGLPFLVFAVAAFAVPTGFLELYLGVRGRGSHPAARDHIFMGAVTVLAAVAILVVPPEFVQNFTGPDRVARQLTASVVVVGLLGAYWAIATVYLVIAGLSLRWGTERSAEPAPAGNGA